jgi:hypothetical protein
VDLCIDRHWCEVTTIASPVISISPAAARRCCNRYSAYARSRSSSCLVRPTPVPRRFVHFALLVGVSGVCFVGPGCRADALRGCIFPRRGDAPRRGTPAPPAHEVRAFSSLRSRTASLRPCPVRHALSYTADGAVRGRRSPPHGGDWARCEPRPTRTQAHQPARGICSCTSPTALQSATG